jgi:hypothetical protein
MAEGLLAWRRQCGDACGDGIAHRPGHRGIPLEDDLTQIEGIAAHGRDHGRGGHAGGDRESADRAVGQTLQVDPRG